VHQIPAWQDNFIYLLVDTQSGESAFIDGPEATPALEAAARLGVRPRHIFNTHTHFDHVGINQQLAEMGRLDGMRVVGPRKKASDVPGLTEPVDEGSEVSLGGVLGRVMLTEGHIDGHVSYVFDDFLFCGDTLFAGGCGYLFDGPPAKMYESLRRLRELDPSTKVLCAHEYTQDNLRFAFSVEPNNAALRERIRRDWAKRAEGRATVPSTIGEERATNPFLRWDSDELRTNVEQAWGESFTEPAEIFAATRRLKDKKDYRSITDVELLGD
jgi:hydroxyacylglutathione hydrolase